MIKNKILSTAVVALWGLVIFLFLYSPLVSHFFTQESINVFMWPGVVDPKLFVEFGKKHGVDINVSYYSGNEELIVKLLATKGAGYDLVVPSDYAVEILIQNDLLKELDKSKLNFFEHINPQFLDLYFDPHNKYSIPAEWYILGLGINKRFFKNGLPPASWKTVFDPKYMPDHIGLLNDPRELIALAVKYKYGKIKPINQEEVQEIKELMCAQWKKAEAYTDFRGDFLLESGNCPVVIVANSYIWKTLADNADFEFLIPEEGTFVGLENYVIPKSSTKVELVYKLLNFLFDSNTQERNFQDYVWLSTRKDAEYLKEIDVLKRSIEVVNTPGKMELFRNDLTDDQVNEIWLAVKGQ